MSDFGISNAISDSNNLISSSSARARDARVHNQQVKNTYDNQVNAIKSSATAPKAGEAVKEGLTDLGGAVAVGKEAQKVNKMGLGNYLKGQPAVAKANLSSGVETTKKAFGMGKSELPASADLTHITDPNTGVIGPLTKPGATTPDGLLPIRTSSSQVLRDAGTNSEEGGGLVEGMARKAIGYVADIPNAQIGALAKGVGSLASVATAGFTGIEDLVSGSTGGSEGKDATSLYKAGNDASLIAGGLDAMSLALPVFAPVALAADATAGIMGIVGESSEASKKASDSKKNEQASQETAPSQIVSQTAQGDVASSSTSQRTY